MACCFGALWIITPADRVRKPPWRSHALVGISDGFVRRSQVHTRRLKRPMPYLLLHDRERQLVEVDVVHQVAMPEAMDCDLVESSANGIRTVLPTQAGLPDVFLEDLPKPIL